MPPRVALGVAVALGVLASCAHAWGPLASRSALRPRPEARVARRSAVAHVHAAAKKKKGGGKKKAGAKPKGAPAPPSAAQGVAPAGVEPPTPPSAAAAPPPPSATPVAAAAPPAVAPSSGTGGDLESNLGFASAVEEMEEVEAEGDGASSFVPPDAAPNTQLSTDGVLNLPSYDDWKAKQGQAVQEGGGGALTPEQVAERRRRRRAAREGGAAAAPAAPAAPGAAPVSADAGPPAPAAADVAAAPAAAAAANTADAGDAPSADGPTPAGDTAATFAERAARRRERRADAERAAAEEAAVEAELAAKAARAAAAASEGVSTPIDPRALAAAAAATEERKRRQELLLLDPTADVFAREPTASGGAARRGADDGADGYDWFSAILGEGQRTGVGNFFLTPYLQSGHIILLLVSLLTANVYSPDFPLTAIPQEYRELIKLALVITYAINTLVAGYAGFEAKARGLSVPFWVGKCFVLGGVALSELTSISRSKGDERN